MQKKETLKAQLRKAAAGEAEEAKTKATNARALRRVARHLPNIEGVRLGYSFYSKLAPGTFDDDRQFTPTLSLEPDGSDYRRALRNLMRALAIRTMRKQSTGSYSSDRRPEFYFEGRGEIGGTAYNVRLRLGYVVPKGCKVKVERQHRTWSTSRTYSAYCSR